MPLKKNYLIAYNLNQAILYASMFFKLIFNFVRYGETALHKAYELAGTQMIACQLLSVLEIVHPILGLTNTSAGIATAQISGRNFILIALLAQEPRLHNSPICWYTFVIWSGIEIIRYPYYVLETVKTPLPFLTWLRYMAWMFFYPTGLLLEGIVGYRSMTYFAETGIFSFKMANSANFAFYFPYFLGVCSIVFVTFAFKTFKYMHRKRQKQLQLTRKAPQLKKNRCTY